MAFQKDRRLSKLQAPRIGLDTPAPGSARFQYELQAAIQRCAVREPGRHLRKTQAQQPRYLLCGPPESGKTALLGSLARHVPPVVTPQGAWESATPDYAWWFFAEAGLLDTAGRYALAPPFSRDHTAWLQILMGLREARPAQPLHGIILTVAADAIAGEAGEDWQLGIAALRQRFSEIEVALGVRAPVYVVVTRCDLIEGFSEFVAHLPEHTRTQVFGWLHTLPWSRRELQRRLIAPPPFEDMGAVLMQRLEQLRLFILSEVPTTGVVRQRLFCFPEEFRALLQRLQGYLAALCSPEADQFPVWMRGLFFCSALQQGAPVSLLRQAWDFSAPSAPSTASAEPYFLHDLLTVILPRDRHLARPVPRDRRRS